MIDIHAHILPELDDGPTCLAQSVEIVERASQEGITAIIATPHAMDGLYECTPQQIINACSLLTRELKKNKIPVQIRPGSEIRLTHDTVSKYDKDRLITLNNLGRYILLELPPIFIMEGVCQIINQLADRGIISIIAHPERNATIRKNVEVVSGLMYEGALMQVTAMSLMGSFGKRIRKISEKMIANDAVTFISSDIHPGRRFMMKDAYERVSTLTSRKTADRIFYENPEELLFFTPEVMSCADSTQWK